MKKRKVLWRGGYRVGCSCVGRDAVAGAKGAGPVPAVASVLNPENFIHTLWNGKYLPIYMDQIKVPGDVVTWTLHP